MSKFYVGQRVRVLVAHNFEELLGAERIVAKIHDGADFIWGQDRIGFEHAIETERGEWGWEHQFAPIINPGREVLDWADERCVWRPEKVTV